MDFIKDFLVNNYGIVGLFLFILIVAIIFMAKYIIKNHKQDKEEWKEERKEFRNSLDKNSEAIGNNTNLIRELNTILKTINYVSPSEHDSIVSMPVSRKRGKKKKR